MNLNRTKKLFSMVCVCSMLTIGSAQAAFAGPSTGYESDMVAITIMFGLITGFPR